MQQHERYGNREHLRAEHNAWLRQMREEYREHVNNHQNLSNVDSAVPAAAEDEVCTGSERSDDQEDPPLYRSLCFLGEDSSPQALFVDATWEDEGEVLYRSLPCPAAQADPNEIADRAWLADSRPPLLRRQHAFERASV
jgi:hypothetical protein